MHSISNLKKCTQRVILQFSVNYFLCKQFIDRKYMDCNHYLANIENRDCERGCKSISSTYHDVYVISLVTQFKFSTNLLV